MNEYDYKNLTPFKWFILENFPFIEETFDTITNYQLFCKLGEEMNKIIDNVNLSGEQVENLTNAFIQLQNYVNNYFDNLDVQDEINNKIDEMTENGELQEILQPFLNNFNNSINELEQNLTQNYSELSQKLNVEKSRIDNLSSLPNGSTTGDAELQDIRIGYDGTHYNNAGTAVRSQILQIKEINENNYKTKIIFNETLNIEEDNTTLTFDINIKQGDIIKVNTTLIGNGQYSLQLWEYRKMLGNNTIIKQNINTSISNLYFKAQHNYTSLRIWSNTNESLGITLERIIINENLLTNTLDTVSQLINSKTILEGTVEQESTNINYPFKKNHIYVLNAERGGHQYSCSLHDNNLPFTLENLYKIVHNEWHSTRNKIFIPDKDYDDLFIWCNMDSSYNDYIYSLKYKVEEIIIPNEIYKLYGKNFACFGDSITSEQATGIGTKVNDMLGTNLVGNFACGYATSSDWASNGENITTISLTEAQNTATNDNVLSNQIRRLLQYTTPLNEQIKWTHPIDGEFSINTSIGVGLGNTDKIPDICYIAIGINDRSAISDNIYESVETVKNQTYSQLTRTSIASSLRWAIETLQSAYPNTQIFVASPLYTNNNAQFYNTQAVLTKREIIKEICEFCCVNFIDSTFESTFSKMIATTNSRNNDGTHPNAKYSSIISHFVANKILQKCL